jgi:hypothetical protein
MITKYKLEAEEKLTKNGIINGKHISKRDFTILKFELIDPISKELLKSYQYTLTDFYNLDFEVRKNLTTLNKSEEFNEKEYQKAQKQERKLSTKYQQEFDIIYNELLEKNNISSKIYAKFNDMVYLIENNFTSLSDNFSDGYSNSIKAQIEFEDEILEILKK